MDFAAVLVGLVAVSGGIMLIDAIAFAPDRKRDVDKPSGSGKGYKPKLPVIVDYARSFFPIFLLVLLLRSFVIEPFRIPSGSMMPTLLVGDFILVNKYTYGLRLPVLGNKIYDIGTPERGDIVVFKYPEDPSIPFIKRIVGLPGDVLTYRNKQLIINGVPVPQEYLGNYLGKGAASIMTGADHFRTQTGAMEHDILQVGNRISAEADMTVPQGHYFVLGDNRDNSRDSRYWGTVPDENLIGKAFKIWMNWDAKERGVNWSRLGNAIE